MRILVIAIMFATLVGCAAFQNVTVDEIRTDAHKRAEGQIGLSIAEIQQSLYDFGMKCHQYGPLAVNPGNPHRASFITSMPGLTKSSAAMVIDFEQVGERATNYVGYTYYPTWSSQLDDILYAAQNPRECKR